MGYIYLMESVRDYDTVYKIGYSNKPKKRIFNVQTGNDGEVKIVHTYESKHGRKLETALHNFFSHRHKNMEWFDLDIVEVSTFIEKCQQIEKNLDFLENIKFNNLYI